VPYAPRIVLHSLSGEPKGIEVLVEEFLKDGVKFVGVVGDGSDDTRFLLTSSHERDTLDAALNFSRRLSSEYGQGLQVGEV
jgi:hypothetical protein